MTAVATQVEPKEKPIIFSGPMVKAILEGRKTQTRRVTKLPPAPNHLGQWEQTTVGGDGSYLDRAHTEPAPELIAIWHTRTGKCIAAPRQVGDRLWVRESLRWTDYLVYDCDKSPVEAEIPSTARIGRNHLAAFLMPRWASRITLEITNVRVERLQEITGRDVLAEGIDNGSSNPAMGIRWENMQRMAFEEGWDSINSKRGYSWASNPWVWVIEFKKL